ncbi:MAG: hypothetical protein ACREUF_02285 [Solimonas sp.]
MSLASFITQFVGLSIAGVTTAYDVSAIPESLADSKHPALIPALPIAPGPGGQSPVVYTTGDGNYQATYPVEFVIYIRPVGQKPPATYVNEMVVFLDRLLDTVRDNDGAFAWTLMVRAPRAGILMFAGIEYVAVVFPVEYREVI